MQGPNELSSGHSHHEGFGLNSQALDRLLKNESVQQHLNRPKEVSHGYDIPYLGSYSSDGNRLYFDRHLPDELTIYLDGKKVIFDPIPTLILHESLEKALIDVLHYDYAPAHKAATAYERRGVLERLGPGMWDPYQRVLEKYIKADEHEKLVKVPKDLDLTPYVSKPVDRKLIAHLEKFVTDKMSKEEAEYTSGKPNHHCGSDKEWPKGFCSMYRDHKCSLVRGYIEAKAGCKYWEKA